MQVACRARSFTRNTFHGAPISEKAESMVVEKLKPRFVENCTGVCLRNSETNSVCKALTQGARCNLDTWGVMCFWMAWGDAIDVLKVHRQLGVLTAWRLLETYSEMLQVIHCDFVPEQVEKSVLEHAAMPVPERMSASTYCEIDWKLSQGSCMFMCDLATRGRH